MVQVHVYQLNGVNNLMAEHFTVNEVYVGSSPATSAERVLRRRGNSRINTKRHACANHAIGVVVQPG